MLINNTIESSRRPGIPGPHRPDLKWFEKALDGKSDVGHVHKKKDIEDFEHNHDGRYYRKDEHELQLLLSGNGTPNFNQGINGDYYVDELNGDLYKKSGDAWNLIIHLEGEQGIPGPQGNPGIRGPEGPTGKEGYTPVRGTDYWTPEDEEIIRQSIVSEVQLGLSGKVDKIEGKGLSTEDFTTLLKQKLEELQNYDDRDIRELLEKALCNVTIDVKTGILTFHTIDESTFTVDLPLELIVSDGYLNKNTNTIVLVLANGNTIDIPVENLIKDFYSKSEVDQKIDDLAEEVAIDFETVDGELAKAQAQIDALKAENEAQQKELDILYNDLVPGEASGETAVVANGVTGSKVEIDGDGNTVQEVIEAVEGTTVVDTNMNLTDVDTTFENSLLPMGNISQETTEGYQAVDDSSIRNYTPTKNENYYIPFTPTKGEQYYFKMITDNPTVATQNAVTIILYDVDKKSLATISSITNGGVTATVNALYTATIEVENVAFVGGFINYDNLSTAHKTIKGLLVSKVNSKILEPYTGGQASPNLNYPSPVKGVGKNQDKTLSNKNILPNKLKTETQSGITATVFEDGSINFKGTSTGTATFRLFNKMRNFLEKGEQYTLSTKNNVPEFVYFRIVDGSETGEYYEVATSTGTPNKNTFTNTKLIKNYLQSFVWFGSKQIGMTFDFTIYPMLEKGNTTSEYTKHESQLFEFDLQQNFNKVDNVLNEANLSSDGTIAKESGFDLLFFKVPKGTFKISLKSGNTATWVTSQCVDIPKYQDKITARTVNTSVKSFNYTVNQDGYLVLRYGGSLNWNSIDEFVQDLIITSDEVGYNHTWYSGKPYKLNGKWYRYVEWEKLYGKDLPWYFQNNENIENINTNRFTYSVPTENADSTSINAYSNILPANTAGQLWINDKLGVARSISQVIVRVPAEITTKAQVQEYFGEDGYIVCKKTPTREEITDTTLIEQLEALQNAEFYNGVTNINSYPSSEDVAEMPLEAHYNFITPAPSVDRESEVEIAEPYNLCDTTAFTTLESPGGITFTNVGKGGIRVKGTAKNLVVVKVSKPINIIAGTKAYISGGISEDVAVDIRDSANNTVGARSTTPNTNTETIIARDIEGYVSIRVASGATVDTIIYPFLSLEDKPYLPYGHIGLVQRGANIFVPTYKVDNQNISCVNGTLTLTDDEYSLIATGKDLYFGQVGNEGAEYSKSRGTLYNVKGKSKIYFLLTGDELKNNYFTFYNKDKISLGFTSVHSNNGNLNIPENAEYMTIRFGNSNATVGETYKTKVMLSFEEITDYEPYIEPIVHSIDLAGEKLAKVGEIADLLNIGVDGRVSIEKNYVFERFNTFSTTNVKINTTYADNNIQRYIVKNNGHYLKNKSTNKNRILCTHFKDTNARWVAPTKTGLFSWEDNTVYGLDLPLDQYDTDNKVIELLNSLEDFKVLTLLQTPETIALPNIEPIELFEGTNVFELITSLPTTLTAHYKVSSRKQLIENNDRITALEATVNTLLGGN